SGSIFWQNPQEGFQNRSSQPFCWSMRNRNHHVSARTTASAPIAAAMAVSDESPETAGHAEGISSAFHATTPASGSSATLRTSVRQLTGDEPFKLALKADRKSTRLNSSHDQIS